MTTDREFLPAGWRDVLEQIDDKHDEGHKRLRVDLQAIKATVDSNFRHFEDQQTLIRSRMNEIAQLAATPVDATKLVLSTKAIISLIFAVVAIIASYWNLSAKVDAQQRTTEATAKLQEVQMKSLGDAVADAKATAADSKRQYELLRYEFQSLKETVIGKGKKP